MEQIDDQMGTSAELAATMPRSDHQRLALDELNVAGRTKLAAAYLAGITAMVNGEPPPPIEVEWIEPVGVKNRVRVNITANTKGYTYDRTAEVEWDGPAIIGTRRVAELLEEAEAIARADIARCTEHGSTLT